jgi:hypothetical protein
MGKGHGATAVVATPIVVPIVAKPWWRLAKVLAKA